MEKPHKIQALYLDDHKKQEWADGVAKTFLEGQSGAQVTFVKTGNEFYRLIESEEITRFDVIILHLGFDGGNSEGIINHIHYHAPEARFGIVSNADEGELIASESFPDFFIFIEANAFLVEQIKKGAITEKEKRWRGKFFLTPEARFDGDEEMIVRREYDR